MKQQSIESDINNDLREFWINIYTPENEAKPGGLRFAYPTKESADQFLTGRVKCIKVREVVE